MLEALPSRVQRLAEAAFKKFEINPAASGLRTHELKDTHKGHHQIGSVSVSISMAYRAIYVMDGEKYIWYWIGSHADYDRFIGS